MTAARRARWPVDGFNIADRHAPMKKMFLFYCTATKIRHHHIQSTSAVAAKHDIAMSACACRELRECMNWRERMI
ncbi:MAG: hypothetical protein EON55_22865 [Alphaproteobacteria bacterium]|nr:MAG: hypothetical protein EON55_22865 [Alphaproteobacteria bacterium]